MVAELKAVQLITTGTEGNYYGLLGVALSQRLALGASSSVLVLRRSSEQNFGNTIIALTVRQGCPGPIQMLAPPSKIFQQIPVSGWFGQHRHHNLMYIGTLRRTLASVSSFKIGRLHFLDVEGGSASYPSRTPPFPL